jgi:hypothetical protein
MVGSESKDRKILLLLHFEGKANVVDMYSEYFNRHCINKILRPSLANNSYL